VARFVLSLVLGAQALPPVGFCLFALLALLAVMLEVVALALEFALLLQMMQQKQMEQGLAQVLGL